MAPQYPVNIDPSSDALIGYWGKPTTNIEWCEKNYEVTYYFAEFWNTVTNVGLIIPPAYGLYNAYRQRLGLWFIIMYGLLVFQGIGSWLFHMSLLFEMQLLDELPMIYSLSFGGYLLYSARNSGKRCVVVATVSTLYTIIFTIVYLLRNEPIVFHIMFTALAIVFLLLAIRYNHIYDIRNHNVFYIGSLLFAIAFILWNIDNYFCENITDLRRQKLELDSTLKYVSPLTQMHGWWHLLSGYAIYLYVLNCIQHQLESRRIEYSVVISFLGYSIQTKKADKFSMKKFKNEKIGIDSSI